MIATKDFSKLLAEVNNRAKVSVIRELLKFTNKPGLISFAGGMPDPTAFPVNDISRYMAEAVENNPRVALQYGQTEGDPAFVKELIKLIKEDENIDITPENILVTSASQQALDIITKAFINPGDIILVGNPTYLGALQAFQSYGAHMIGVESDDDGMTVESLAEQLENIKKSGKVCKFIYVVPDFQNKGVEAVMIHRAFEAARRNGVRYAEATMVNERNLKTQLAVERVGGTVTKVYRQYRLELAKSIGN